MKKNKFIVLITAICAVFAFTSCTGAMQKNISMNDYEQIGLSSFIKTKKDVQKLDMPKQINVAQGNYSNKVTLSWSKVENAGAYRIERASINAKVKDANLTPTDSDFEIVADEWYTNYYTDTVFDMLEKQSGDVPIYALDEFDYRYYYRVTALNEIEGYTESNPTANTNYGTVLAPPKSVTASMGLSSDYIDVEWTPAENASRYNIYRTSQSDGSAQTLVKSVPSNISHYNCDVKDDERGVSYYYTVATVNIHGEESIQSMSAMGYALKPGAPSKVTLVQTSSTSRGVAKNIEVEWTKSTGSGEGGAVMHYTVYRSSESDPQISPIKGDDGSLVDQGSGNVKFTDTTAKSGDVYVYYVKPWEQLASGEKVTGSMSTQVNIDNGGAKNGKFEAFILSAPKNAEVQKSVIGSSVINKISFSDAIGNADEQYAYRYKIYGSNTTDASSFVDTGIEPFARTGNLGMDGKIRYEIRTPYKYYKVSTVNGVQESALSSAVSAAPFAATAFAASKDAYIEGYFADDDKIGTPGGPNKNSVMPVKITWSPSSSNDASGFYVCRSSKWDGSYSKISSLILAEDGKKNYEYIDENKKSSPYEFFVYKILSVNETGKSADYSYTDPDYGYGSLSGQKFLKVYDKTNLMAQTMDVFKLSDMDKAGAKDQMNGKISGTVNYSASMSDPRKPSGVMIGSYIDMTFKDFSWFQVASPKPGDLPLVEVIMNGHSDTCAGMKSNMSIGGQMLGDMRVTRSCVDHEGNQITGMYTGFINYDHIKIVGTNVGDGYYTIHSSSGRDGDPDKGYDNITPSWKIGQ